jgi:GMP synthase-like glutamine amidotransferase
MRPRILVVQNAKWEDAGLIGVAARAAGIAQSTAALFPGRGGMRRIPFEELEGGSFAAVVSLGSPLTAYLPETNPHHDQMVDLFKLVRRLKIPSFDVCYSMQLFSLVHGGKVEKNPNGKEVGFAEVGLTREGTADAVFGGVGGFTTLQWHGDCVTALPAGAVHLGFSEKTKNQVAVLDGIHYLVQGDGQAATPPTVREWLRLDRKWAFQGTSISEADVMRQVTQYSSYFRNTYLRLAGNFLALAVPAPKG